MTGKEAGHKFLARLGKTRLRPGGRRATEWLLDHAALGADSQVLEVACNMGTTAIAVAQRYGCHITGVDMDAEALARARQNVAARGLQSRVTIAQADALHLPYPDASFDVVINEAMLTMYADKAKPRLVAEYFRVLKPGGRLLTHDIMFPRAQGVEEVLAQMRRAINVNAQPMTLEGWRALMADGGFARVETLNGAMTLLSPRGLLYDEGVGGTLKILSRALRAENRSMFWRMFRTFRRNSDRLNFIAICSEK
ncbi:class I SAM-dependent methyltransferase [Brenneria populi subsp. brevivirga]|uniref:SAM-dependent methyltransferase n=1 Tax=Brenneria populi TaxID=1505588 RepID=UPI002E192631|nr:class I SAM-dependent methyltransferase [Brenneria populi subsp. brevivirga]